MATERGYSLATKLTLASSVGPTVSVIGGRHSLVVIAAPYSSLVSFQLLGPDNVTWITLNGSTISANGATAYDLPSGQYRMLSGGAGSSVGLYAALVSVPYA